MQHVGGDVGGDSAHFAIAAAIVLAVFNSSGSSCGFQIMTTATNTVVAGSGGRRVEQRKDVLRVVSLLFEVREKGCRRVEVLGKQRKYLKLKLNSPNSLAKMEWQKLHGQMCSVVLLAPDPWGEC